MLFYIRSIKVLSFILFIPKVSLVFGNKQYLGGISVTIFIPYSPYNFNHKKLITLHPGILNYR